MRNSQPDLQAHCQSPASQRTNQSFVKELAKPTQNEIGFKNFPALQKNKKRNRTADNSMTQQLDKDNGLQARWTEGLLLIE